MVRNVLLYKVIKLVALGLVFFGLFDRLTEIHLVRVIIYLFVRVEP